MFIHHPGEEFWLEQMFGTVPLFGINIPVNQYGDIHLQPYENVHLDNCKTYPDQGDFTKCCKLELSKNITNIKCIPFGNDSKNILDKQVEAFNNLDYCSDPWSKQEAQVVSI